MVSLRKNTEHELIESISSHLCVRDASGELSKIFSWAIPSGSQVFVISRTHVLVYNSRTAKDSLEPYEQYNFVINLEDQSKTYVELTYSINSETLSAREYFTSQVIRDNSGVFVPPNISFHSSGTAVYSQTMEKYFGLLTFFNYNPNTKSVHVDTYTFADRLKAFPDFEERIQEGNLYYSQSFLDTPEKYDNNLYLFLVSKTSTNPKRVVQRYRMDKEWEITVWDLGFLPVQNVWDEEEVTFVNFKDLENPDLEVRQHFVEEGSVFAFKLKGSLEDPESNTENPPRRTTGSWYVNQEEVIYRPWPTTTNPVWLRTLGYYLDEAFRNLGTMVGSFQSLYLWNANQIYAYPFYREEEDANGFVYPVLDPLKAKPLELKGNPSLEVDRWSSVTVGQVTLTTQLTQQMKDLGYQGVLSDRGIDYLKGFSTAAEEIWSIRVRKKIEEIFPGWQCLQAHGNALDGNLLWSFTLAKKHQEGRKYLGRRVYARMDVKTGEFFDFQEHLYFNPVHVRRRNPFQPFDETDLFGKDFAEGGVTLSDSYGVYPEYSFRLMETDETVVEITAKYATVEDDGTFLGRSKSPGFEGFAELKPINFGE